MKSIDKKKMSSGRQTSSSSGMHIPLYTNLPFKPLKNSNVTIPEEKSEQKKSCSDSKDMNSIVSLTEQVDTHRLMYIIEHFEALKEKLLNPTKVTNNKNYATYIYNDMVNLAKKYNKKNKDVITFDTKYRYGNGMIDGRLYGSKGMQSCPRRIRHTLCKDLYDDLDFVNSSPTILEWYCKKNGIACEKLSYYVNNREKVLQSLSNFYKCTPSEAKTMIIALINNGYQDKNVKHLKWIRAFRKELTNILQSMKPLEPEAYKRASFKNPNNKLGSMMSMVMGRYEGTFLKFLQNSVQQDGLTVGVLCLDGLMIEKNTERKMSSVDQYEELINKEFGIDLKLKIKPMDEGLSDDDMPHDYKFDGKLKQLLKKSKRSMSTFSNNVSLDDLREDETINLNNIGSYMTRLSKAEIVMLRSNMMTFKTQNLIELFTHYKKILIVSFRISLDKAYLKDFGQYGFQLYGNKATYSDDRLIVQADSLHKVRGMYDLMILDEFIYTKDHIISFAREKKSVWEALEQYILNTGKVIICDALLNNSTVEYVKSIAPNRTTHIVDNKWASFKGKNVKMYCDLDNSTAFIVDVVKAVTVDKQKVYIPTNAKTLGIKLYQRFKKDFPDVRVGFCAQGRPDVPVEEWVNYDLLITTPTNVAGLSQNVKHFDRIMGYFTPTSCNAEMACQMLFRVRNTTHDTIYIYIKGSAYFKPVSSSSVDQFILEQDQLHVGIGLTVNRPYNCIIKDSYYECYKEYVTRNHHSFNNYSGIMGGILEHHGIVVDKIYGDWTEAQLVVEKELEQENLEEYHLDEGKVICNADDISPLKYKQLNDKNGVTLDEQFQCRKHKLQTTYDKPVFDGQFVVTFEKLYKPYGNLCKLKKPGDALTNIQEEFKCKEHHIEDTINQKRLHAYRNTEQMFIAVSLLKAIGFDSAHDTRLIEEYPYDKVKEYLIRYGDKVAGLFKKKKVDWSKIDVTNSRQKQHIAKYTNTILNEVFAVKVNTINKKSKAIVIKGLDVFTKEGIDFVYRDIIEVNGIVIETSPVKEAVKTSRPNIKREYNVIIPCEHDDEWLENYYRMHNPDGGSK